MFELKNISFSYREGLPTVLENVSLTLNRGEFIALTGRNGSGKTTVTRILTGLEKPTEGLVIYNGNNVTTYNATKRSRFIGYVFQQPERQMFMNTVHEEVGFGPYQQGKRGEELDALVKQALEDTDLVSLAESYPRILSRGDQQRVAIASALAMKTDVLILDEPTSGQDGYEKKRLMALMERLREKGITILLVTHDMEVVSKNCTRVIVIADKTVTFDGTPEKLFSAERRLEDWGLAYPPSVLLGRELPGTPYCKDMETFCRLFIERKERSL